MDDHYKAWLGRALLLLLVFCVTDCTIGHDRYCPGQVQQHVFHPAYTTVTCSSGKNGSHCTSHYHPAEYHLLVICQAPHHVADVDAGLYDYTIHHDGQSVVVGERLGRWSGIVWSKWIDREHNRPAARPDY